MKKQKCTILLIAVNVIAFLALSFTGMTEDAQFMLEHGAMYVPYMVKGEEYYRLFTSMFMHFDMDHLLNNMLMLAIIGWNLEFEIGKIKFLIIYFGSGLCGNILSAFGDILAEEYVVSAGASGAVFGIVGALLYVALRNRGQIGDISVKGLVFMVILSLYYGVRNSGVDNLAHIGGLVSGFLLAVLLYWKRNRKHRAYEWD